MLEEANDNKLTSLGTVEREREAEIIGIGDAEMCHERETWNGNGIRAATEKTDGMSTYIYLEIVSTLQRSRTTFISGVRKNRRDFKLILSSRKSIIMNIH